MDLAADNFLPATHIYEPRGVMADSNDFNSPWSHSSSPLNMGPTVNLLDGGGQMLEENFVSRPEENCWPNQPIWSGLEPNEFDSTLPQPIGQFPFSYYHHPNHQDQPIGNPFDPNPSSSPYVPYPSVVQPYSLVPNFTPGFYQTPQTSSTSQQPFRFPYDYQPFSMPPARKAAQTAKRTGGGRRPKDSENGRGMTKEEKDKRDLRRERNKQAAARCRQRRQNKLDSLQEEVNGLEKVTGDLSQEIKSLEAQKAELAMILESHKNFCKLDPSQLPSTDLLASMAAGQSSSSFAQEEFNDRHSHNDLNVQLNETVICGAEMVNDYKRDSDEPHVKRFKQEPSSNRSSPETKTRPNTLGLGMKTTDIGMSPALFLTGTPSLGMSCMGDTPSKVVYQSDPFVAKLLQGSTGMTPVNPAIQPAYWEQNVTGSMDTPVNPPTDSIAGNTATTTTNSRPATLLQL